MRETNDTNDRRTPPWFVEQCAARFGPFDNRWRTVETPAGRRRVTEYRLVGEFDGVGVA